MKKILVSILLVISVFVVQAFILPEQKAEAYTDELYYTWGQVEDQGEWEWVCYFGGQKVFGWHYVNGEWYYLYPSNGFMAHNTFINGYYVNRDGAWTNDIPYEIQRIKDVVPYKQWINTFGNDGGTISLFRNQNLKNLYLNGWDAPDVNGTLVIFGEGGEHFVADDGTVFNTAHQGGENIIQYDNNGNIVKVYPYIDKGNLYY